MGYKPAEFGCKVDNSGKPGVAYVLHGQPSWHTRKRIGIFLCQPVGFFAKFIQNLPVFRIPRQIIGFLRVIFEVVEFFP